jgi:hypothetical protein
VAASLNEGFRKRRLVVMGPKRRKTGARDRCRRKCLVTFSYLLKLLVAQLTHQSARDDAARLANWNTWLPQVQNLVTADPGDTKDSTPYGTKFKKKDLEPIPARDLAFGVPRWMGNGDTAWRRPTGDQITWKATAADG